VVSSWKYGKLGICISLESFRGRLHLCFGCAVWMCVSLSNAFWM
jgi:hypothetical protein